MKWIPGARLSPLPAALGLGRQLTGEDQSRRHRRIAALGSVGCHRVAGARHLRSAPPLARMTSRVPRAQPSCPRKGPRVRRSIGPRCQHLQRTTRFGSWLQDRRSRQVHGHPSLDDDHRPGRTTEAHGRGVDAEHRTPRSSGGPRSSSPVERPALNRTGGSPSWNGHSA